MKCPHVVRRAIAEACGSARSGCSRTSGVTEVRSPVSPREHTGGIYEVPSVTSISHFLHISMYVCVCISHSYINSYKHVPHNCIFSGLLVLYHFFLEIPFLITY